MATEFHWCGCRCHDDAKPDATLARDRMDFSASFNFSQQSRRFVGVSPRDVIEAAAACPDCLALHCPALLERRIWWDEHPPTPIPAEFTAEE